MKKATAFLLCMCLLFSLSACGGQSGTSSDTPQQQDNATSVSSQSSTPSDISLRQESETDVSSGQSGAPSNMLQQEDGSIDVSGQSAQTASIEPSASDSKILIAYFTWADNTHVEDPASVDVDATTSASVLPPGNAAQIAGWIQQRTGGDLFSIVVTEPYSSDYDECLDRAADEKAENARPALANHLENMDEYDVVFIGFPNWWYTVPMAVHSFLDEYDFSGKTVIPFVTHGTSGLSRTIQDITASLPETAEVLEPIGVYRPDVAQSQPAVDAWLDGLEF